MHSTSKVAERLFADFNQYSFRQADDFSWSPDRKTIHYPQMAKLEDVWSLMHEIAHAELQHIRYVLDIELIKHEANAWYYASHTIAPRYTIEIDDDYIQDHLDTYRAWLHARSTCPTCGQNGLQTQNTYRCINCRCLWQANEARICALRRTKV